MLRRNLAQLRIEVFDCDFLLTKNTEEGRYRPIGDAKLTTDLFVPVEQFGRDRASPQHTLDNFFDLRWRDARSAATREVDRDISLGAIDHRTARRLRPHLLRAGRRDCRQPSRGQYKRA
jgi:hypothetical protein